MKNILFISLDENLFTKESTDVLERQITISKYFNKLTFIVFTRKNYERKIIGNIELIPTNSKNIISGFFKIIKILRRLKKEKHGFDSVSTQDPFFLGLLGIYASKLFKAKFKPQIHTEIYDNKYWKYESSFNLIQYYLSFFVLNYANNTRVVNIKVKNYLDKNFFKNSLIPIGTDQSKFKKLSNKKRYDLLFIGRLVHEKNLFFLIEVIKELKLEFPNIKVAIVGKGPLEGKITKRIIESKLEKNVFMIGFKQHKDLIEMYNQSKIFMLPSLYEGFGLVAIEASLSEIPVIMSQTGCAGEIIINNKSGKVCQINDKKEFVNATRELLNNPELRKEYALKAKNISKKNLNQDILRKKWVKFLNE